MDKKERIKKGTLDRYEDLLDYLEIIEINKYNFWNSIHRRAKYKTLLFSIRVLIGKNQNECLVDQICEYLKIEPKLKFSGMRGVPDTNPLSKSKIQSFEEYISDTAQVIEDRHYSNRDFIWELASQDGAHSDSGIHPDLATGYSMLLFNATPNERMVYSIAKTVYKYGWQVINYVNKNPNVLT